MVDPLTETQTRTQLASQPQREFEQTPVHAPRPATPPQEPEPDRSLTQLEKSMRDTLSGMGGGSTLSPSIHPPSHSILASGVGGSRLEGSDVDLAEALLGEPVASDDECSLDFDL